MTERNTGLHLDYSALPIADPHAGIAPERKLVVLSTNPSTLKLFEAEKGRAQRIIRHRQEAEWQGLVMDQRRAEMEARRESPAQREIAA